MRFKAALSSACGGSSRVGMRVSRIRSVVIVVAISGTALLAQVPSTELRAGPDRSELDEILRQADARRQDYVDVYKNVTAVETQLTELFDKNGKVDRQRRIVSDFFV